MLVESVRLRLLLIGPLRLVLALVWLGAARAAGGSGSAALLAFAAGAFAMAFLIWNDPRARLRRALPDNPAELPADASVAPAWRHAVHAAYPSTIGVSVLATVTLAFNPTLTALLAGVLAGLGLAALLWTYSVDGRLYVDPRTGSVFRK
jgi:hypothetical protein